MLAEESKLICNPVTLQEILDLLPKRIELTYIDYRDSFDESIDKLQECISNQDLCPLDESIDEWLWESQDQSIDYLQDELKKDLISSFDLSNDDADYLLQSNEDAIKDEIYNRDSSNPIKDLLRNTDDIVAFYDTGFFIESESWTWDRKEMRSYREKVKRVMQIKSTNHDYDRKIELMLGQASYGGRLVIYFLLDGDDFMQFCNLSDYNTIQFTNPMIAVIDTFNGSGDNTDLPKLTCQFKLNKDNIVLDKTIKYNYTYSVCGMFSNWCDCTGYKLLNTKKSRPVNESSIGAEQKLEAAYNKVYKSGRCTFGDMDINRHRNKIYVNDFPCGSHCTACGTFWID